MDPSRPRPRPAPPQRPDEPSSAPCEVWSSHAAELAERIASCLERWEETPSVQAMVEDGLLARVLPGIFLPPDLLDTTIPRLLALGCALEGSLRSHHVVAGASAAWVLLGGPPPQPATLLSAAHRDVVPGVSVRHARLLAGDVETLGGAPVTTPLRTAVDLLRDADAAAAQRWVPALLEAGHIGRSQLAQELERRRGQPRIRAAGRRLAELTAAQGRAA